MSGKIQFPPAPTAKAGCNYATTETRQPDFLAPPEGLLATVDDVHNMGRQDEREPIVGDGAKRSTR